MKNKYQRMSKEEKKKLKKEFAKTKQGKDLLFRLKRLLIIGIIGIVFSILLLLVAFFNKESIFNYIEAIMLLIASVIFLIGSIRMKGKQLNNYALKKK